MAKKLGEWHRLFIVLSCVWTIFLIIWACKSFIEDKVEGDLLFVHFLFWLIAPIGTVYVFYV